MKLGLAVIELINRLEADDTLELSVTTHTEGGMQARMKKRPMKTVYQDGRRSEITPGWSHTVVRMHTSAALIALATELRAFDR